MPNIVPLTDLTQASIEGAGVFDTLMRAMKVHLEGEYQKGRIKGPEYSTVYLGSLDAVMRTALDFLVQRQRIALEAELMAQQILVAQAEVAKANAQVQVAQKEVEKITLELEIMNLSKDKIPAEIAHLQAQTTHLGAQTTHVQAQKLLVDQQKINLVSENLKNVAQTELITQQKANAVIEGTVLQATKCKLDAEYDVLLGTAIKVNSETQLLNQKTVTERAQVSQTGVDPDSVIGKQKGLYQAQTDGFSRDAEQKAAKLMMDVWNVQRTTDEGIQPSATAKNTDEFIGRAVGKMLSGIGA